MQTSQVIKHFRGSSGLFLLFLWGLVLTRSASGALIDTWQAADLDGSLTNNQTVVHWTSQLNLK
jgi:hypothetical protein